ncbi:unnamed protein product, partial [Closterium sp. NIES-53]
MRLLSTSIAPPPTTQCRTNNHLHSLPLFVFLDKRSYNPPNPLPPFPPSFLPIRACVLSWLQMQWAAEEELYGEKILSDLGHPLSLCMDQPPPLCPLCCARTQHQGGQQHGGGGRPEGGGSATQQLCQEAAPAVLCVPCGEFFCHRCFHE